MPRLEVVQPRGAVQGRRGRSGAGRRPSVTAASCARRGRASSSISRSKWAGGVLVRRQGDRADRGARSDAGRGRGVRAQARRHQGRRHGRGAAGHRRDRSTAGFATCRRSASATTRTYRVEVELPNADGAIPDGITAEVTIPLAPVAGDARAALGVDLSRPRASSACALSTTRTWSASSPVSVIEDEQTYMWLGGIADGARVIVQGQDFVREGQRVEAVPAAN